MTPNQNPPPAAETIRYRRPEELTPNPLNPRGLIALDPSDEGLREMADSIRERGVLQPLTATPEGVIVMGHRRHAAARLAMVEVIPVIERRYSEAEQVEIMLIENIQRQDLTPLQEARGYARLIAGGQQQAEVARRLGVTANRVYAALQILKLFPEVQEMFNAMDIPVAALAPLLGKVKDEALQKRYAIMAVSRRMPLPRLKSLIEGGEAAGRRVARKPDSPPRPSVGPGISREQAVRALQGKGDCGLSLAEVLGALDRVCCACGMRDFPVSAAQICAACPLPQLVMAIVEAAHA